MTGAPHKPGTSGPGCTAGPCRQQHRAAAGLAAGLRAPRPPQPGSGAQRETRRQWRQRRQQGISRARHGACRRGEEGASRSTGCRSARLCGRAVWCASHPSPDLGRNECSVKCLSCTANCCPRRHAASAVPQREAVHGMSAHVRRSHESCQPNCCEPGCPVMRYRASRTHALIIKRLHTHSELQSLLCA